MSRLMILIGGLLIILAVVLVAVIVPSQRVFPDDVDTVREFDVSYLRLLNPDTLEFLAVPEDEADDLTIRREVVSQEVDGDNILVWEGRSILKDGDVVEGTENYYALNRTSMVSVPLDTIPEDWTQHEGIWPREGIVINWNVDGVRQEDYVAWNDDTRATVDMVYQEEVELNGMPAYYFTSSETPQKIHPDHVDALGLPTELTLEQVGQLARTLPIEDPLMRTMLPILLPQWLEAAVRDTQDVPEDEEVTVPLEYYYDYEGHYWVEPTTGALLNTTKYEHRAATFPAEILAHLAGALEEMGRDPEALTALLPVTVFEFEYTGSEQAQEGARADAQEALDRLNLFGTTLPIVLVVVGALLILGGAYLSTRNQPALATSN